MAKKYVERYASQHRYGREKSRVGMEIGAVPGCVDPDRRKAGIENLLTFCDTYFAEVFDIPWSADHLKVISQIDAAVKHGGLFAIAMPRGSGKTSIVEAACLWSILGGYRRYVVIIGANKKMAANSLGKIATTLETNELLAADFPDIVYPILKLERITQRQAGQIHNGQHTRIKWNVNEKIAIPALDIDPKFDDFTLYKGKNPAGGSAITCAGLDAAIRGQNHATPEGKVIRPDFVFIDDPQTRESAMSASQTDRRMQLLHSDVLGLAGAKKKIAGVLCCTVISGGDLADQLLDRKKSPEWQGQRLKLMYSMPTNSRAWDEYEKLLHEDLRAGGNGKIATDYYAADRQAMDEGASPAWLERYNADELSAIQHAMNLKIRNAEAFASEYQNEPLARKADASASISQSRVCEQAGGIARGVVPIRCQKITAFIDVHKELLYYCVVAWEEDFTGHVIDYGTWPQQQRLFFTMANASETISRAFPGMGTDAAIKAAIEKLLADLTGRIFTREDAAQMRIDRLCIDGGYKPDEVVAAIRRIASPIAMPSRGVGIKAADKPFAEYIRSPGDLYGLHWRVPSPRNNRGLRILHIDTNYWKSTVANKTSVHRGDPGSLQLFGQPADHRLFAEHLAAEFNVTTEGRGRVVYDWRIKGAGIDNHWFDCLVGCCAAASLVGVCPPGMATAPKLKPKTRRVRSAQYY